jgi:hypothetical protein
MNAIFQKLNFKGQAAVYVLSAPDSFGVALDEMRRVTEVKTTLGRARGVAFALCFATKQSRGGPVCRSGGEGDERRCGGVGGVSEGVIEEVHMRVQPGYGVGRDGGERV